MRVGSRSISHISSMIAAALLAAGVAFAAPASAQMMSVPGKFDVNQSGAAIYSVPISLPPGTAGMVPTLSLDYSSQSGDGVVGVGWSLSGLPAIGRCGQTTAQDGAIVGVSYTTTDRFCLAGQRLIATSGNYGADGTVYHTEIEGFSKIISHGSAGNGPAWFEVHTKSGQIMEFGNTADSQMLAYGLPTARAWGINKVSDTKGNYFTVVYGSNGAGLSYPTEIDYTGNATAGVSPYNKVTFTYNTGRPDPSLVFQAGAQVRNSVLLTDITTYQGTTSVADYKLTYAQGIATSRSHLNSLTICDTTGTNCLPATTFTWSDAGTAANPINFAVTTTTSAYSYPGATTAGSAFMGGDFNGDGKTDIAAFRGSSSITTGSCNGCTQVTSYYAGFITLYTGDGAGNFTKGTTFALPAKTGTQPVAYEKPMPLDYNGTGLTGFFVLATYTACSQMGQGGVCTQNTTHYQQNYFVNTPSGWVTSTSPWSTAATGCSQTASTTTGDFNGDGRSDLTDKSSATRYMCLGTGNAAFTALTTTYVTGGNYTFYGDVNGDGKTDMVVVGSTSITSQLSLGANPVNNKVQTGLTAIPTGQTLVSGDFNGDGLTDFALVTTNKITTYLANGDGTFSPQPAQTTLTIPTPTTYTVLTGNFAGSGRTDFVLINASKVYAFRSLGDGTFSLSSQSITTPVVNTTGVVQGFVSADFNGDGKSDFSFENLSGTTSMRNQVFTSDGVMPDQLTSVSTGVGGSTSIVYSPLTSSSVYTKGTGAVYPTQDFIGPMYVVSQVSASTGLPGSSYVSNYSYAGAQIDLSGRGFLGFGSVDITDQQTGIYQVSLYHRPFPCTGLPISRDKWGPSTGQHLEQTSSTYQVTNGGNTSAVTGLTDACAPSVISTPTSTAGPYTVEEQQNVMSSWDLDGSAKPAITTNYTYDGYGNTTQTSTLTPDGGSKVTTNVYAPDATNWYLDRLTSSTVTSTTP